MSTAWKDFLIPLLVSGVMAAIGMAIQIWFFRWSLREKNIENKPTRQEFTQLETQVKEALATMHKETAQMAERLREVETRFAANTEIVQQLRSDVLMMRGVVDTLSRDFSETRALVKLLVERRDS